MAGQYSLHQTAANMLALAHQLGGVPMTFKGNDVVTAIVAFATEYAITHILMGKTQRPWYRRWLGQSLLDRLLRSINGIDVLVADSV